MGTGYSGNYTNTKGSNTPVSKTGDVVVCHAKRKKWETTG